MSKRSNAICGLACAMLACTFFTSSAQAVSDVFAIDLRAAPNRLIRFPVNAPALNVISASASYDGFAMDFNNTATTLYGITFSTPPQWGTISTTTGNFTPIAPISGDGATQTNFSGLASHPNGTFYASSVDSANNINNLYTVNPLTGATTLVGPMNLPTGAANIDISIDANGNMYGHDIVSDMLLSINTGTGAAALIGPTGQAASFAQGMDFDWETNTLYATIYTGGGTGAYGTFNLATGAFTPIVSTTPWNIEAEMSINSPIPEPASLAVLALSGLALVRGRRN